MKQKHKYFLNITICIAVLILFIFSRNNTLILNEKLYQYRNLDSNIAELKSDTDQYYSENSDRISKYLELESKYEELEEEFIKYKENYPSDLVTEIEDKKDEVNENKARYSQYEEKNTFNQKYEYKDEIEKEVEELVKNIKGVNKAKVMITLKSSEERIVKEDNEVVVENDERETNKTGKESKKNNTVIVDGENGEQPYVVKELYPQVEGVAVCIKGNFDSEIKNNIISIIQALFDIESHKISVTEMK